MTTTIVEEGLDTDFFSVVDFGLAPPCEAPGGCAGLAEWKVRTGCCGHLYLLCQECIDTILEWYRHISKVPNMHIKCRQCKNSVPVTSFIHSIERI